MSLEGPGAGRAGLGESGALWPGALGGRGPRRAPRARSDAPVSLLLQSRKGADPERDKKVPECKADSIGSGRAIPMKQVRVPLPLLPEPAPGSLGGCQLPLPGGCTPTGAAGSIVLGCPVPWVGGHAAGV